MVCLLCLVWFLCGKSPMFSFGAASRNRLKMGAVAHFLFSHHSSPKHTFSDTTSTSCDIRHMKLHCGSSHQSNQQSIPTTTVTPFNNSFPSPSPLLLLSFSSPPPSPLLLFSLSFSSFSSLAVTIITMASGKTLLCCHAHHTRERAVVNLRKSEGCVGMHQHDCS